MKTPEEITLERTLEWLNERDGTFFSNGEKIVSLKAPWENAPWKNISASIVEEWLLSPSGEPRGTNLDLAESNTSLQKIPWKDFNPKKWIKHLGRLKEAIKDVELYEKKEMEEIGKFLRKVDEWKEFKEEKGIPMG